MKNEKRDGTKTVTFRPSEQVARELRRLAKVPHTNRSWVLNRALAAALPAVLDKIGA